MDMADGDEHGVLDAVFSFIDEWEERSDEVSKTLRNDIQQIKLQPWLEPFTVDDCAKRGRTRRELPKQELMRLREEVPLLENKLKTLQSARTRYEAANCAASRVVALAASELRRERPDIVNTQLFLVWKEMAKKHEQLRKEVEEENRILREHVAHQSQTIESLQKLRSTANPKKVSLKLLFPRSNTISNDEARKTLVYLSDLLTNQFSETNIVFQFGNMPPTLSEVSSETVSSTQKHLEFLHSNYLPFHFQMAAKALWKKCQRCQQSVDLAHGGTLTNSFASSYEDHKLSFVINGHSTMRMHNDFKRNVIVSSSKYDLLMLLGKNYPGVSYNEKGWVVFEPVHDDTTTELCILRVCTRIEINVEGNLLSDRERYMDLLSELLLEQKRQELDAIRLCIEDDLLAATIF